jgi:hypothetical protein
MSSSSSSLTTATAELETRALTAERLGRFEEALAAWRQLLVVDPDHLRALTVIGADAQRRGQLAQAREVLTRAASQAKDDPTPWITLAQVCRQLRDDGGEQHALTKALSIDPQDLLALLLRGQLLERQGHRHQAARSFAAAMAVAPPVDRLRPDLRPALAHAAAVRTAYDKEFSQHLDAALDRARQGLDGADLSRFSLSVDIMLGRKKRYESQPSQYLVPHLPPVEFFDRGLFPWLGSIEAETDVVRTEFLEVLRADEGFAPYLTYSADQPVNQFAELNNSPRWSAYHLIKDGKAVADAAAKCPRTLSLLAQAPQPDQPGRTPVALFSLLKPRTRIPSHTGVSNARLLVHLPLIIPPGCGFRVGNQVREWVPGQALVFDDTIEHEAWNDSDQLRVIMIFDIWHPALSEAERSMITAMSVALNEFVGMPEGYGA